MGPVVVAEAVAASGLQVRLQVAEMRDPMVVLRNNHAVEQRLVGRSSASSAAAMGPKRAVQSSALRLSRRTLPTSIRAWIR
jgi:hypothetical protein